MSLNTFKKTPSIYIRGVGDVIIFKGCRAGGKEHDCSGKYTPATSSSKNETRVNIALI